MVDIEKKIGHFGDVDDIRPVDPATAPVIPLCCLIIGQESGMPYFPFS